MGGGGFLHGFPGYRGLSDKFRIGTGSTVALVFFFFFAADEIVDCSIFLLVAVAG